MVFDHDPVEWCSWPSRSSATSGQIVLCRAGGLLIGVVDLSVLAHDPLRRENHFLAKLRRVSYEYS